MVINTNGFLNKNGTHVIWDATLHRTSNFVGDRHHIVPKAAATLCWASGGESGAQDLSGAADNICVFNIYIYIGPIYRVYIPGCGDLSSSLYSFVSSTVPPKCHC